MTTKTRTPKLLDRPAAEVMTPDPVTIHQDFSLKEGVAKLLDLEISAVAVVDRDNRAVGVFSRSDVVRYEREHLDTGGQIGESGGPPSPLPEFYQWADVRIVDEFDLARGFEVEEVPTTRVAEIMNPIVFSVRRETPVREVIEEMIQRGIHRLFVTEGDALVGVVSAHDILRHLVHASP